MAATRSDRREKRWKTTVLGCSVYPPTPCFLGAKSQGYSYRVLSVVGLDLDLSLDIVPHLLALHHSPIAWISRRVGTVSPFLSISRPSLKRIALLSAHRHGRVGRRVATPLIFILLFCDYPIGCIVPYAPHFVLCPTLSIHPSVQHRFFSLSHT
jgi:hypothetical protein